MKQCKKCSHKNPTGANFCEKCGADLRNGSSNGFMFFILTIIVVLSLGLYFTLKSDMLSEIEASSSEYVDLGLPSGTKWATCNLGASRPQDRGNYYAWGETQKKSSYRKDNCSTLYSNESDFSGSYTNDPATVNKGGSWRTPTLQECKELANKCQWYDCTLQGVTGKRVVGPNGKEIFLPNTGYYVGSDRKETNVGNYWTSTPNYQSTICAAYLFFINEKKGCRDNALRSNGVPIRPVRK